MYGDHRIYFSPIPPSLYQPSYNYDVDDFIEAKAIHDLRFKRLQRTHLLASDIFCRSSKYQPILPYSIPTQHYSFNTYRSTDVPTSLPRPITPIRFPRISSDTYQSPIYCKNCHHYDFSNLNLSNREPSLFPLAESYYNFQTNYETFHNDRYFYFKRMNLKRRWKLYGLILIFYFMLKRNLRLAKQQLSYYARNYRRIRFLELLTAIHRVYLEPNSPIYKALSYTVKQSFLILDEQQLFRCVQMIIDHITNFIPKRGILGTDSDESVLIYLLSFSVEQYPPTYLWSIERHLLSLSYSKMRNKGYSKLDHFTTKFLLISVFIFRCLTKTLLLKPVKYRLIRGKLNRTQWLNTRLLSTLILFVARHAVLYKEHTRLPMPLPFEMKNYLLSDEKVLKTYQNIDQLVESTTPKLSSWACVYAERLHHHIKTKSAR